MTKKNLLLIVNQLHYGGAQKVVANLSRDLSSSSNVFLAIFNDIDNVGYSYGGNLIRIKAPFSSNPDQNHFIARTVRLLYLVMQFRKIKKKYRIDVAISFLEAPNIINVLSRRKEKVILSVRSYLSREIQKVQQISIYEKLVKKLYNKSDFVVVPSISLADDLNQNFGIDKSRLRVINNYLDHQLLSVLKEENFQYPVLQNVFKDPVLINVGRLHDAKGQMLLLPVLKMVKEKINAVRLIIVGQGELMSSLIAKSKELGLKICLPEDLPLQNTTTIMEYDVFLLGPQKNPYQYLEKSSLFLFPSIYEGFPNAMLEAMAMGLPVISADCNSGPREILAPETDLNKKANTTERAEYGILMPIPVLNDMQNDEVLEWSRIVAELLINEQEKQYYSEQAKKRAMHFGKDAIISQWLSLINN